DTSERLEGIGTLVALFRDGLEAVERVSIETSITNQLQAEIDNERLALFPSQATSTGGKAIAPKPVEKSLAEYIRIKPHDDRTKEEKQWVALDVLVNPELYWHVKPQEAEEMRWDPLYYTPLDADYVRRILDLPEKVQQPQ
ncbi:unnamed protein product, partial [Chrysoparadoxa australica]